MEIQHIGCPFCERAASVQCSEIDAYAMWECSCGAVAVGAHPADLDEAAEQLLDRLGIDTRVSEPVIPVGTSGMVYAQRYNSTKVSKKLREILSRNRYEVRETEEMTSIQQPDGTPMDWTTRLIWVKLMH
jgi:hypothetical protein